ncbi:hypothetical protein OPT61_g2673 [Boeremia exigua]|uniref:Uncharacterized protein n=1 Tax=Boeremia exigua TaxID=749465 RepID=A0ACC2IKN4_9PLEO|nr:hypothetical protein OPT61_g2673 [Boeremia exigua]
MNTRGPYWDMVGEFEAHTTKYTLTVQCPPRPLPDWLPAIFTRPGPSKPNVGTAFTIRPSDYNPSNPNYNLLEFRHLKDMDSKTIKIISDNFPADLRCDHVSDKHHCERGCYVLEKGGNVSRWTCAREDCEGHVYCGLVKKTSSGTACFGKKGARMVCAIGR